MLDSCSDDPYIKASGVWRRHSSSAKSRRRPNEEEGQEGRQRRARKREVGQPTRLRITDALIQSGRLFMVQFLERLLFSLPPAPSRKRKSGSAQETPTVNGQDGQPEPVPRAAPFREIRSTRTTDETSTSVQRSRMRFAKAAGRSGRGAARFQDPRTSCEWGERFRLRKGANRHSFDSPASPRPSGRRNFQKIPSLAQRAKTPHAPGEWLIRAIAANEAGFAENSPARMSAPFPGPRETLRRAASRRDWSLADYFASSGRPCGRVPLKNFFVAIA